VEIGIAPGSGTQCVPDAPQTQTATLKQVGGNGIQRSPEYQHAKAGQDQIQNRTLHSGFAPFQSAHAPQHEQRRDCPAGQSFIDSKHLNTAASSSDQTLSLLGQQHHHGAKYRKDHKKTGPSGISFSSCHHITPVIFQKSIK
jgi:hypothetical protein